VQEIPFGIGEAPRPRVAVNFNSEEGVRHACVLSVRTRAY
jgi:hypothetical protein